MLGAGYPPGRALAEQMSRPLVKVGSNRPKRAGGARGVRDLTSTSVNRDGTATGGTSGRLWRSAAALCASAVLAAVAACTAGSTPTGPATPRSGAPEPSGSTSTTSTTAYGNPTQPQPMVDGISAWPGSICAKLDPKAVTAVFGGTPRTDRRSLSTWVDTPTYDMCSIGMDLKGRPGRIYLGTSVLAQTPASWAAAVAATRKAFPGAAVLPGATPGYVFAGSAATLIGDRGVRLTYSFGLTADQATKLFALLRPVVAAEPLAPLVRAGARCDRLTETAAAVIGQKVVIRRDITEGPGYQTCAWAGELAGVSMRASAEADPVGSVKDGQQYSNAQTVPGLGAYATWVGNSMDGYVLGVATPNKTVLWFEVGFGQAPERSTMVELARAALAAGF